MWAGPDAHPPEEGKTSGNAVSHVLERHVCRHRALAATRQHKQQHMPLTESVAMCRQSGCRSEPPPGLEGSSSLLYSHIPLPVRYMSITESDGSKIQPTFSPPSLTFTYIHESQYPSPSYQPQHLEIILTSHFQTWKKNLVL